MSTESSRDYRLGEVTLTLVPHDGGRQWDWDRVPFDVDILSTLVLSGVDGISALAAELIYEYGAALSFIEDAMWAYVLSPLDTVPAEYVDAVYQIDWTVDAPTRNERCVFLAGLTDEREKRLLLDIVRSSASSFCDAPILAASNHRCVEIIDAVLVRAMSLDIIDARLQGDLWAFAKCIRRWIDEGVIEWSSLLRRLRQLHETSHDLMDYKQLANYIACLEWDGVPFLDAFDRAMLDRRQIKYEQG